MPFSLYLYTLPPKTCLLLPDGSRYQHFPTAHMDCPPPGFQVQPPNFFGQALQADLSKLCQTPRILLHYVNDLLLCSPSEELSIQHTVTLLNSLTQYSYQVSKKKKAQLASSRVSYLGLMITRATWEIPSAHKQMVQSIPFPHTKRDCLSFLGLIGYFQL